MMTVWCIFIDCPTTTAVWLTNRSWRCDLITAAGIYPYIKIYGTDLQKLGSDPTCHDSRMVRISSLLYIIHFDKNSYTIETQ